MRYPAVSHGIPRYPAVSDGIRRYPAVSRGIPRYPAVSQPNDFFLLSMLSKLSKLSVLSMLSILSEITVANVRFLFLWAGEARISGSQNLPCSKRDSAGGSFL